MATQTQPSIQAPDTLRNSVENLHKPPLFSSTGRKCQEQKSGMLRTQAMYNKLHANYRCSNGRQSSIPCNLLSPPPPKKKNLK